VGPRKAAWTVAARAQAREQGVLLAGDGRKTRGREEMFSTHQLRQSAIVLKDDHVIYSWSVELHVSCSVEIILVSSQAHDDHEYRRASVGSSTVPYQTF